MALTTSFQRFDGPYQNLKVPKFNQGYGFQALFCHRYENVIYGVVNHSQNLVTKYSES